MGGMATCYWLNRPRRGAMLAMSSTWSRWLDPTSHDALRSVDLVRVAVAIVLVSHPLHALIHPDDVDALARGLALRHVPAALGVAWAALAAQLGCALALLVRRLVRPAAAGSIVILAGGIALLYAPYWFVVGGATEDGHP